jgi:hypothetical protein
VLTNTFIHIQGIGAITEQRLWESGIRNWDSIDGDFQSSIKQGKYLPGSHIPIVCETSIMKLRPNYILILPWNLKDEIMDQLSYVKEWNCQFIVPIPEVEVL